MEEQKVEHAKDETVTISKNTLWKAGTFVFAVLFVVSLFTGGFSGGTGGGITGEVVAPTNPTPTPSPTPSQVKVQIENNDPVLGKKDAPVTIVEFSDFQCPFCQRAFTGAVTEFKNSDYFKSGKVNLVYKHFPLNSIHPYAQKAAEAAECANRQGKFWDMHDKIFTNQQSIDVESLKRYASDLRLDTAKFNKCLDSNEATSEVNKETSQATSAGGQGTPYFVVINNGDGATQAVSGAVPFAQFESAINAVA
ncbi:DsbA family protein [Candidatus Pacearchaeota archaeon]|nr:DsbA family protein [Candidatus Pacearchaeota archaeon]